MHSTRRIDEESRVSECAFFPYDVPAPKKGTIVFSSPDISGEMCICAHGSASKNGPSTGNNYSAHAKVEK